MMHIEPACAPAKDTKKCVVRHVSCDATQRRAFKTALCIGALNRQQTNRNAAQQ